MQQLINIALALFLFVSASGQEIGVKLLGGPNFGGPVGKVDSADGSPRIGFELGVMATFNISPKWSIRPSLYYTTKGADYSQKYTRDTIVEIEIQGITGEVPTFYRADVNGEIRTHYLELPVMIAYRNTKGFFIETGPYLSFLLSGNDAGSVHLDIGEDGFISDDRNYSYDDAITQLEYGLSLTGGYEFNFGLSIYLKGTRSLNKLYQPNHFDRIAQPEIKLYNTLAALGLRYTLFRGKEKDV